MSIAYIHWHYRYQNVQSVIPRCTKSLRTKFAGANWVSLFWEAVHFQKPLRYLIIFFLVNYFTEVQSFCFSNPWLPRNINLRRFELGPGQRRLRQYVAITSTHCSTAFLSGPFFSYCSYFNNLFVLLIWK